MTTSLSARSAPQIAFLASAARPYARASSTDVPACIAKGGVPYRQPPYQRQGAERKRGALAVDGNQGSSEEPCSTTRKVTQNFQLPCSAIVFCVVFQAFRRFVPPLWHVGGTIGVVVVYSGLPEWNKRERWLEMTWSVHTGRREEGAPVCMRKMNPLYHQ